MKVAVHILLISLAILGTDGVATKCFTCYTKARPYVSCEPWGVELSAPCTVNGACSTEYNEEGDIIQAGCVAAKDQVGCRDKKLRRCTCDSDNCNNVTLAHADDCCDDMRHSPVSTSTHGSSKDGSVSAEPSNDATTGRLSWSTPTVIVLALVYSPLNSLLL